MQISRGQKHLQRLLLLVTASLILCGELAWAKEPLKLGVFPRRNATVTIKLFKPLAQYLEQQLKREVVLVTEKDFPSFWRGVQQQKYDLVHYNQLHYLQSRNRYGYEVILMNEEQGKSTISAALVTRKDSGITNLKQLKGKSIAFGGDHTAMVSYVANTVLLHRAGLNPGDYRKIYTKNPPNACIAAYQGIVDAAGIGDVALKMPVVRNRIDSAQMHILARSEPLSHLPWAMHKRIDPKTRNAVIRAMLALNKSDTGKTILAKAKLTALHKASDKDYELSQIILNEYNGIQENAR
jgi:phosphonate transport system substrate-binding protein